MKAYGEDDVCVHVFLTLALVGGEWSVSCPGCFTLRKESPVPIGYKAGHGENSWPYWDLWTLTPLLSSTYPVAVLTVPSPLPLHVLNYSQLLWTLCMKGIKWKHNEGSYFLASCCVNQHGQYLMSLTQSTDFPLLQPPFTLNHWSLHDTPVQTAAS
jgi:hypothetical protein